MSRQGRLGLLFAAVAAPFLVNGYVNARLAGNPLAYWAFEVLVWVVVPLAAFALARARCGVTLERLGLHRRVRARERPAALVLAGVAVCALGLLVYWLSYRYFATRFPGDAYFRYQTVVPETGPARLAVALYLALTAGFVEELLYRGAALEIARGWPRPLLVFFAFSPLVFAAVHWEGGAANVAATYVTGWFAAAAYVWLRNLWPLVAGHVLTDLVTFA